MTIQFEKFPTVHKASDLYSSQNIFLSQEQNENFSMSHAEKLLFEEVEI